MVDKTQNTFKVNESLIWWKYFYYDETSPSALRWKIERRSGKNHNRVMRAIGDMVGSFASDKGYRVNLEGTTYTVGRIVVELVDNIDIPAGSFVDHINGIRTDNRRENLRIVSCETNNRNMKKGFDNTSGVVGVNVQVDAHGSRHWVSTCYLLDRARVRKCFSVNLYGEDKAFEMACSHRQLTIEQLNTLGAGYTERHGT